MEELYIMREQLENMKRKLDCQQIVNDALMRKVMKAKSSWLNNLVTTEFIILPILYFVFVGICWFKGISQWFSFTFLIFAGIDNAIDLLTIRIPSYIFNTYSIIEVRSFLIKQKKRRLIQTCISTPVVIIWLLLFFYSLWIKESMEIPAEDLAAIRLAVIIIVALSLVIALLVIIFIYKRIERTNNTLIQDLNDLNK